jgi:uncharacterized protein (DUF302 family)
MPEAPQMPEMLDSIAHQQYGFSKIVQLTHKQAVEKIRDKLKEQGFGVLTEIDIRKAMKEKLNIEYPNYVILGACNPRLAHQALQFEPRLGLLLPCNVVVREVAAGTEVGVIDADAMLSVVDNAELRPVAREASERLQNVLKSM